jgi:hypothetical protein
MSANHKTKKRYGYRYRPENPLLAIIIDQVDGKPVGRKFHTQDLPRALKKFEANARLQFPYATHINYYRKGDYYRRTYLIEQNKLPCNGKVPPKRYYYKNYGDDVLRCVMENSLH